jgi:glucose/arabinose dehydrogenase
MTSKTVINGDNGSNALQGTEAPEIVYGFTSHSQEASIQATKIASGFTWPALVLAMTAPPNDPDHLFIVQRNGVIKVLEVATGEVMTTPFLDISSEGIPMTGEQGMLGLAFDPDYDANGHVYVYVSTPSGDVEIRRYTTSDDDPYIIDPNSKHVIKTIDFPEGTTKHRSGWIDFGPDGYLYVAVGDAENGANAQRLSNPFGKILRLDVRGDDYPDDPSQNYAVPEDNPQTIAGIAGDARGTGIYAAGLRNPWKGSFDRATGDLYISDVGDRRAEEINLIQAGANYGWSQIEGYFDQDKYPHFANPIHAYNREEGTTVVGGYVYRGQEDAFHGQYVFGDYNKSRVWTMSTGGSPRTVVDITEDVGKDLGRLRNPVVFGEDALGNLYMATAGDTADIVRLTPQTRTLDGDDVIDAAGGDDVVYAGAGDDRVFGGTGNDTLSGMNGSDSLDGGSGQDRMLGGSGNDIYVVDHVKDMVVEKAGDGKDTIKTKVSYALSDAMSVEVLWTTNTAGAAAINLTGNKLDNQISGNAGINILSGRGGSDMIRGLGGDDQIDGGTGKDDLHGDDGDDRLYGGEGDDKLEGGAGLDRLTGGSGADIFVWLSTADTSVVATEADIVIDFNATQGDLLSLLSIDAREDRDGGQAFSFIGIADFTRAGQVRYEATDGTTLVYLNTDADLEAEGVILLRGTHTLGAENFIL